jgi:cellulose synthase/poly-beta-1,6-N-acetylglucosamine synthase-like glycosyltransferase
MTITNFLLLRSPSAAITPSLPTPLSTDIVGETVGVFVPLRNEADNVKDLISTLSEQVGDFHFYLLDDNSEDRTFDLLNQYTAGDSRFTIIKGSPLAQGWIGKTWALQQLFIQSKEEFLVSVDADVRLTPDAIARSIATLKSTSLDFISPYPRQIALTLGERMIQPLLQWSWLSTVNLRIAEKSSRPSMAIANGQFFLVRRKALEKIGGYAPVKNAVIDDVFLARELIRQGFHGSVINGASIAECHMYTSWSSIKSGYGKSLNKAFGGSLGASIVIFFLFLTGIAPFLISLTGNFYGWLGYVLIVFSRMLSAIKVKGKIVDSFFHPISVILLIYLIIHSFRVRSSITWKGRTV